MVSGPLRNPFPSDCEVGKIKLPGALDLLRTSSAMDNVSDYKSVGRCLPWVTFYPLWEYEVKFLLVGRLVWVGWLARDLIQGRRVLEALVCMF